MTDLFFACVVGAALFLLLGLALHRSLPVELPEPGLDFVADGIHDPE